MQTQQKTSNRTFDYGVGALAILAISIGLAIVVYVGVIKPDFSDIPSWLLGPLGICTFIFGPLGVYTVIYSAVARKESTYYLVWGTIILAVAVISGFYNTTISPFLVVGVLIILLAVIGLIAYMRGKK